MTYDPAKEGAAWKRVCEKEEHSWLRSLNPYPGESVLILGVGRRPELNGLQATVLNNEEDGHGRIVVGVTPGRGPLRRMRINVLNLSPVFQGGIEGSSSQ